MPIALHTNKHAFNTTLEERDSFNYSCAELSTSEKQSIAEQLLSFKRVSVAHNASTDVKKLEAKDNSSGEELICFDHKKPEKGLEVKRKSDSKQKKDSHGRMLPKHAVAILKEWILSPEHFNHPYPTEEEKKILIAKTRLTSKQMKYWFINARRRLWKQKLAEHQDRQSLSSVVPQNKNNVSAINDSTTIATGTHLILNIPQWSSIHPRMPSVVNITPPQQAVATLSVRQQEMLHHIVAVNAAATQLALPAFVNSDFPKHHQASNDSNHFTNVFLPQLRLFQKQPTSANSQLIFSFQS